MADTNLETGDATTNAAAGKGISQLSSAPSQTITLSPFEASQWLTALVADHTAQIREITFRLDDLPNKFIKLEAKVEKEAEKTEAQGEDMRKQGEDVRKLQSLEVIVRKQADEVVVRLPVQAPPVASDIAMRRLEIVLYLLLAVVVIAVAALIWIQVQPHV